MTLSNRLHERIIGQDTAVTAVSEAILRSRAGIGKKHRPTGSFLFLGPTGVGKTELAKALAEELFDDDEQLVRIDMSEYMYLFLNLLLFNASSDSDCLSGSSTQWRVSLALLLATLVMTREVSSLKLSVASPTPSSSSTRHDIIPHCPVPIGALLVLFFQGREGAQERVERALASPRRWPTH